MSIPCAGDLKNFVNKPLLNKTKLKILEEISRNIDYLDKRGKLKMYFTYNESNKGLLDNVLKRIISELESKGYKTNFEEVWEAYELTFWAY